MVAIMYGKLIVQKWSVLHVFKSGKGHQYKTTCLCTWYMTDSVLNEDRSHGHFSLHTYVPHPLYLHRGLVAINLQYMLFLLIQSLFISLVFVRVLAIWSCAVAV